jgi:hypothetical protein
MGAGSVPLGIRYKGLARLAVTLEADVACERAVVTVNTATEPRRYARDRQLITGSPRQSCTASATSFVILSALIGTLATQATPTREQETISLSTHERQHCVV